MPGTWMRGEERKNESTKGGERERIEGWWRPRPGRYDHYRQHHHRHLYHDDEHDTGQSAELGSYAMHTPLHSEIFAFLFSVTLLSFSLLSLSLFLSRRIHLPILSSLALSTIRHFKREHPPSMGRFPQR